MKAGRGWRWSSGTTATLEGTCSDLPGAGLGGQAGPAAAGQRDQATTAAATTTATTVYGGAARHGDLGVLDSWDPAFECSRQ